MKSISSIILYCLLINLASSDRVQQNKTSITPPHADCVVLLHGMGRTDKSMNKIERQLAAKGYEVINLRYLSMTEPLSAHMELLDKTLSGKFNNTSNKIHFVTHSLGGILVRQYLKQNTDLNVGRVVMLAPPNAGSELADIAKDMRLLQIALGKTGVKLGTGTNDLPKLLGPVKFELGIIAGDRTLNPLYSSMIDGPNDGKVSVENARVEGMTDFLVVHSSHTFMMRRQFVIDQIIYFLENGKFKRADPR